jgi:etoposide-induced 2.4 mRNA
LLSPSSYHLLSKIKAAYDPNGAGFSSERIDFFRKLLWFYPLYIFSFILSNIWYNDIAKYGFSATGNREPSVTEPSNRKDSSTSHNSTDKATDLGGVMIVIAEQIYSVLLLTVFFLEQVSLIGYVPYIGKVLNFLLLSWMYAYYCFEYKWNLSGLSLDKRLEYFESNWTFYVGFGSDAEKVIDSQRKKWRAESLGRLPIFCVANYISMRVLSMFPVEERKQMQDDKEQ